jgi:hypothetical protein
MHRGTGAGLRVGPLRVGEEPLGEPRAPLQRPLEAVDLQQVDADCLHESATLTDVHQALTPTVRI